LHGYLAGLLKGVDCPTLQAGGVDDHVHLLFGLSRARSTSEVVETVKTSSSKWIKTVSQSEAETVVTYIKNQARHHQVA
jgi:putative transposase